MYWNDPTLYGTTFANKEFIPQQFPYYAQHLPYFQGYTNPWIMNQYRFGQPTFMPFERSFMPFDRRFMYPGFEYNTLPQQHNVYGQLPYHSTFRPFI